MSALVTLLGPETRVVGVGSHLRTSRVIGSGPRAGESVPVSIDTHVAGILTHESGAISTLLMSFDAVASMAVPIEVHGDTGTLAVPDPNVFDGAARLFPLGGDAWAEAAMSALPTHAFRTSSPLAARCAA